VVHIDYFPIDELKKQFEELLRAYRDYELVKGDQRNRNDGSTSDTELRRLQKKAKLAKETFKASFGEKLEQMPTLLVSLPFEHAITTMVEWASQLLPRQVGEERFRTVEECSSRLRELISESADSSCHDSKTYWPFIQKLRVYLNAYILSKGLIIADLPGLRDLNSARKAVTERYVRQCHQILVVARIDRAATDESIKDIFELARRVNLSKIDIVCTRSEDIHTKEARVDWPARRAEIEAIESEIDAKVHEIEGLNEEIDDLDLDPDNLTRDQERQLRDLNREYRNAKRSKEEHEFKLRSFIMQLRNDKVSSRLREEHRNYSNAATLNVFCVSNKIYWKIREKPGEVALSHLKLSGVLELRRYCIGIVAQSRHRATAKYIKDEIPALIGSVQLWVEAGAGNGSAESKQAILDAVSAIEREFEEVRSHDF
jgi:hypothetical protein